MGTIFLVMNKSQERRFLAVTRNWLPPWSWGHKSDGRLEIWCSIQVSLHRDPPEVGLVEKLSWHLYWWVELGLPSLHRECYLTLWLYWWWRNHKNFRFCPIAETDFHHLGRPTNVSVDLFYACECFCMVYPLKSGEVTTWICISGGTACCIPYIESATALTDYYYYYRAKSFLLKNLKKYVGLLMA